VIEASSQVDVVLVAGGRWHDIDFARARLLSELDRHDVARTKVRDDFSDSDSIRDAAVLITYTSDVRPTASQSKKLQEWLAAGGRWLSLHATCSAVDPPAPDGERLFTTPRVIDSLAELVGGQFLAHPPIAEFLVETTQPTHPLVAGLAPFRTVDELYVCEIHPPIETLLHTVFDGDCRGFAEGHRPTDPRQPILWQKQTGSGTTTSFTLGHCRGRWDVADLGIPDTGMVHRVAWESDGFLEVLRRTVAWAVHGEAWSNCLATSPQPA
jgi:type 1 glutamine amidotransferase